MNYAVIDIETRIDKSLVKMIYESADDTVSEEEAYQRAKKRLLVESGGKTDFFPVPFHIPVSIVIGQVNQALELINLYGLGEGEDNPAPDMLVTLFWEKMERFNGCLVTFNGRGFDLPVLELQALKYGISAPRYFDIESKCRYRFSDTGHFDLMDFLTNYNAFPLKGGLNILSKIIGLPGKGQVKGEDVQQLWEKGEYKKIYLYCRKDVILTYFLFLKVELLKGKIGKKEYENVFEKARPFLDELLQ